MEIDTEPPFNPVARAIWHDKYRCVDPQGAGEADIDATWRRVAGALAAAESRDRRTWARRFHALLTDFTFLPGGRILAGAGTGRRVTLFNCFVMGRLEDSIDGIFSALREGALTMHQGGGVGYDFSTLRPAGTRAEESGSIASGPLSFMQVWDSMCATLLSTGARRGAMMATLRCDHPDIEAFIDVKRDPARLRRFNLSVLVSDAFMRALEHDQSWPLVFPLQALPAGEADGAEVIARELPGYDAPVPCKVWRRVSARALWRRLMQAAYDCAEPGVLFIDRINAENNLYWCERISATNPCGEIPLPPYGACNLGSLNLTRFVDSPFSTAARFDFDALERSAGLATRMLDNVISVSRFPLRVQRQQARASRRIGLGLTGLADALIMLGLCYDSPQARELAAQAMRTLCHGAYRDSIALAAERGSFPLFDREAYLDAAFIRRLPADIRDGIARDGIRNSHLCAIAPAGTISLLANNVSSGLEPVYAFSQQRRILQADGQYRIVELSDYARALWRQQYADRPLPPAFVASAELVPQAHLQMQAALQPHVDSAISKTINVPQTYEYDRFEAIYREAYRLGLKGCTAFRPNAVTGSILAADGEAQIHCCNPEREAD
ncbi:adenosylcobalamin-dependent ribonucleoside-diphosphate reductase [Marinobacterium ramblicola]|uniref:adenosylcobalamin-dependent ribonucleoside-diphosphate reductase n=1 Tax=Marinobacterium ramblicola TaxID=2849041 RepID=UPI0031B9E254